jgi:hypothetical protein
MNDRFVADCGVHHGVLNRAIRPFDLEILLNEIGAFPVDTLNEFFPLAFATS